MTKTLPLILVQADIFLRGENFLSKSLAHIYLIPINMMKEILLIWPWLNLVLISTAIMIPSIPQLQSQSPGLFFQWITHYTRVFGPVWDSQQFLWDLL